MCSEREWFIHFTLATPVNIVLGDNSAIHGTGVGRIAVQMRAQGRWCRAVLQDVLYVPELHAPGQSPEHASGCFPPRILLVRCT